MTHEQMLDDVWEVIHEWNHHLTDMFGGEDKIPVEDQDKLDDAKGAMAMIRESLGLPSEVELENSKETILSVYTDWEFKDASADGCQEQLIDLLKEIVSTKNFDTLTLNYKTK